MRIANLLLVGLALTVAAPLYACPDEDDLIEWGLATRTKIKFPGVARAGQLRGDHLLCVNDANRLIVVDLKRGKTHDLGATEIKRWHDGDVADGHALLIVKDRLHSVALATGKTAHDVAIGTEQVLAFGFAAKGQAFVHRGKSLAILDLATGKTLHTVTLGDDSLRRGWAPWQKVGNRLFVAGPSTSVCVIDLDTGKLTDRFGIEARNGIAALHVIGSQLYCIGSSSEQFTWSRPIDHLTCFDMERKKSVHFDLQSDFRRNSRFASAPYGTVYLTNGNRIDRFGMDGTRMSTFAVADSEQLLTVWNYRAIVAVKGEIRLQEIKETPIVRK